MGTEVHNEFNMSTFFYEAIKSMAVLYYGRLKLHYHKQTLRLIRNPNQL